ncbi:MAG: FtsW/RodA/SpoVE family cell cycle protein [Lachnospiraceae bacterium]|mgnify:CR=1 FL=1|nr:FtsW/RodA/SpoVE family cell cycle protein [Lachnospiraceae bacterium]
MLRLYRLKNYNFRLVLWLLIISITGIALVGSAQESLQNRQIFGVALGITAMIIVSLIDYSWVLNFYWLIYTFNIVLLLFVRLAGKTTGGATRWLNIFGFQFQPTEPAKIMLILFFARFLMDHENDLNTIKTIFMSLVLLALPLTLVLIQPDLKNTITLIAVFCLLIYVAGLSYKIIGGTFLVVIPLLIIYLVLVTQTDLPIIKDYQKDRVMAFFYPDDEEYEQDNTQQENSIIAIGSGQLKGKGLKNNEVSANNGNFVSQIQTDFIFAVAGEELGFIGGAALIILEFLISIECILTSRKAKDLSGTLICCGVGSVIALQSFINICVATGLFPNTGTPLPFVSYGLTSIVSLYIGVGFILNVGLQNRTYPGGEKA